jgi:nucleotide-binding universal stress UspA family protein
MSFTDREERVMISIKKVLVPTDFSETAGRAVNHGALLANAFGAKLILMHVLENEIWQGVSSYPVASMHTSLVDLPALLEEHARNKLDETAMSSYVSAVPERELVILKEYPAVAEIAKYAKANSIDLIVIGTHGRTGISEWLFGSTTEKLLRVAPCPVLTIGPKAEQYPEEEVFDKVFFPFDLSDASKHALRYACAIAQEYNAELDLMHVIEYKKLPKVYGIKGHEIFREVVDLEKQILEEMDNEVSNLYEGNHPYQARFTVKTGKPFKEIIKFAEESGAKLIVVGNTGINETRGHKLGSTAENVVPRASCPVLVVNNAIHEFLK